MTINNWNIEEMTGYKPLTTYYMDFSIADKFGKEAIVDTLKRAFKEHKNNYKILTEITMVLNWKIWEHNNSNQNLAILYNKLFGEMDNYMCTNLKGEELQYYFRTTD